MLVLVDHDVVAWLPRPTVRNRAPRRRCVTEQTNLGGLTSHEPSDALSGMIFGGVEKISTAFSETLRAI